MKDFQEILKSQGKYQLFIFDGYRRFRADSNRDYTSNSTIEYLHYLQK